MDNKNLQLKQRKQYNNYLPKYDLAAKPVSSGYQFGTGVNTDSFNSTPGEDITQMTSATNKMAVTSGITRAGTYGLNAINNLATNWSSKAGMSTTGKITGIAGAAYGTFDMGNNWYKNYNDYRRDSDLMQASGTATQSFGGVDTTLYTGFNPQAERDYAKAQDKNYAINSTVSGAGAGLSLGSIFGPIGAGIGAVAGGLTGFIGSLFGNKNREEELEAAMQRTMGMQGAYNLQAMSEASSQGMRNKFNIKHGEGTGIIHADVGKDAYMPSAKMTESKARKQKFGVVWGPDGKQFGPINSLVGYGESLIDYNTGKASLVTEGTVGNDDRGSIAEDGDPITIAGNDKDWLTGNTFAKLVAPYTKMVEAANRIIEGGEVKNQSKATKQKQIEEAMKLRNYALGQMKPITDRQQWQHGFKFNKGKLSRYDSAEKIVLPEGRVIEYPTYTEDDFRRSWNDFDQSYLSVLPDVDVAGANMKYAAPIEYNTPNERRDLLTKLSQDAFEKRRVDNTKAPSSIFGGYSYLIPHMLGTIPGFEQWAYYKGNQPYAANSYIANPTARQALNILGSMRYDPYNKIQAVKDANRQAIYNIIHSGGLGRGQKMAMLTAQNNNYAKNLAGIYGDADQINNQYKQVFANALNVEGRDAATRSQQALATQQANYAKAVAVRRRGIETSGSNIINPVDRATQDGFNRMIADRILSFYEQQLGKDKADIARKYGVSYGNFGKDSFGRLKRRKG